MEENNEFRENVALQLFRRIFLLENKLTFFNGMIHEDDLFSFQCILLASRVMHIKEHFYHRRVRANSIMTGNKQINQLNGRLRCIGEAFSFINGKQFSASTTHAIFTFLSKEIRGAISIYHKLVDVQENDISAFGDTLIQVLYLVLVRKSIDNEETIRGIKEEIRNLGDSIQRQNDEIAAHTQKIATKNQKIKNQKTKIQIKNKKIERQNKKIETQKGKIASKNKKIEAQKQKIAIQTNSIKKLQKKIDKIVNSKSYKIGRVLTYLPRKIHLLTNVRKKEKNESRTSRKTESPKSIAIAKSATKPPISDIAKLSPITQLNNIYKALQDEKSKLWFTALLESKLSDSLIPIYDTLLSDDRVLALKQDDIKRISGIDGNNIIALINDKIHSDNKTTIVFYGKREINRVLDIFKHYKIDIGTIYVDDPATDDSETVISGIEVKPVEELLLSTGNNISVVVCDWSVGRTEKVCKLTGAGFLVSQIYPLNIMLSKQYFDDEIMIPGGDEVFIDGGGFDGGTSMDFVGWCNGNYKKIFVLEPDGINISKVRETFTRYNIERADVVNAAVWSSSSTANFSQRGTGDSRIVDVENSNDDSILSNVVSIDDLLQGEKVTFIKLDVEGAELEALKGARESIVKYRPRLAVCLYHKPNDLAEIPQFVLELNPDYKLYIRHYYSYRWETVLLAV